MNSFIIDGLGNYLGRYTSRMSRFNGENKSETGCTQVALKYIFSMDMYINVKNIIPPTYTDCKAGRLTNAPAST